MLVPRTSWAAYQCAACSESKFTIDGEDSVAEDVDEDTSDKDSSEGGRDEDDSAIHG